MDQRELLDQRWIRRCVVRCKPKVREPIWGRLVYSWFVVRVQEQRIQATLPVVSETIARTRKDHQQVSSRQAEISAICDWRSRADRVSHITKLLLLCSTSEEHLDGIQNQNLRKLLHIYKSANVMLAAPTNGQASTKERKQAPKIGQKQHPKQSQSRTPVNVGTRWMQKFQRT